MAYFKTRKQNLTRKTGVNHKTCIWVKNKTSAFTTRLALGFRPVRGNRYQKSKIFLFLVHSSTTRAYGLDSTTMTNRKHDLNTLDKTVNPYGVWIWRLQITMDPTIPDHRAHRLRKNVNGRFSYPGAVVTGGTIVYSTCCT